MNKMVKMAVIALGVATMLAGCNRKEKQMVTCISNMKQLQVAAVCWQMDGGGDKVPKLDQLCGPEKDKYIRKAPVCPAGGIYTISKDAKGDIVVECSNGKDGHILATSDEN